VQKHII